MAEGEERNRGGGRRAHEHDEESPRERRVTDRQAAHLARLSGHPADELAGRSIAEIEDLLRWRIDPFFFLFRRVCGRVVRVEPGTGVLQGVPNATVHVEDTDCSFLGFFPVEGPWTWWWWFWPIWCRREDIATTITDECGRFCVWIPRWDIDRILHWRRERICFPEIVRPSLADLLKHIAQERPPIKVDPNPPDPAPFELPEREVLEQATQLLGAGSIEQLTRFAARRTFGEQAGELHALLEAPAFVHSFEPPLNDDALRRLESFELPQVEEEGKEQMRLDVAELSPRRALGPYLRCRDVWVPEWQYVFDVPDITFRVEQDVDLDGDEETIYSESLFDVRWNAGAIPPVTLVASPIARPSPFCDGPAIPCGNRPAIVTVGLMPLAPTHHDNVTGYATRVNRPRPGGLLTDPQVSPAQAPYAGTLQLHGCHHLGGAQYYRLLYSYDGNPEVPFTGLQWYPPKLTGPPWWYWAHPDANGWYDVLPEAELVFPHWLLNWPTSSYPDGTYVVRLQLADGAKNPLAPPTDVSDPVTLTTDNRSPQAGFSQIRWRAAGGAWLPQNTFTWPFVCIVIHRPRGVDIEVEVTWWASATHFRDAEVSAAGCGGGNPGPVGPQQTREHWHQNFLDNSVVRSALYGLPGTLPQGSYSFSVGAYGRPFNPAGDGGGPGTNWLTNYAYSWVNPSVAVSVIDT